MLFSGPDKSMELSRSPGGDAPYFTYPEVEVLVRIAGRRAADALRAPLVMEDKNELAALFTEAETASVTISTYHGTARFASLRSMVEADLRGWLPVMGVGLWPGSTHLRPWIGSTWRRGTVRSKTLDNRENCHQKVPPRKGI